MKFLRYDDMYDNDILWKIKMLKKRFLNRENKLILFYQI